MDKVQAAEVNRRLENWGAWARTGSGGGGGACGSAERRYVPPRDDDNTRAVRILREPIMVADAEVVERAVLKLRSTRARRVLVSHYVEHATQIEMARMLNVQPMMVGGALAAAQGAVAFWLDQEPARIRVGVSLQSSAGSNMCVSR